ncbi:MAG: hypothetical protein HZC29_00400 [Thaumarchaeota archaeon]|nr:hypothetical protein [Nitrososphaerota archaeon]
MTKRKTNMKTSIVASIIVHRDNYCDSYNKVNSLIYDLAFHYKEVMATVHSEKSSKFWFILTEFGFPENSNSTDRNIEEVGFNTIDELEDYNMEKIDNFERQAVK